MSLKFLLDTNICIYIMKQTATHLVQKFDTCAIGEAAISLISYGELFYGVAKSQHKEKNLNTLVALTKALPVVPLSLEVGQIYGTLRSQLEREGKLISNNDLWIAAHALDLNITLITNNTKEFSRISTLKIDNWL